MRASERAEALPEASESTGEIVSAKTADTTASGKARRTWPDTFRALRYRDYRYLWLGQLGHSASIWMEQVVRPLLMLELTGSALQVGLVVAARTLPMLFFGVLAGAAADRYDKRRVLMLGQAVTFCTHLALGLLIVSGRVQPWHIMVTAFVAGTATAFNQPVRQALVPRLVPRGDLLNAVALNQAAGNTMRVLGAGLAGLLLIFLDFGEVYLLNAMIYAGVIWTTVQMVVPEEPPARRRRSSLLGDLAEGLRYVGHNRRVLELVAMAMVLFIFGMPYQQLFVPLLAHEVLNVGRAGVGWMLATTGIGALAGSLAVASRNEIENRERVMLISMAVFSLALIVLAQSLWAPLSFAALLVAGSMSVTYMALNNSLLLEEAPPEYHGRVMSLMSLDRGVIPLGAVLGGALAEAFGPHVALTVMAGICLTFAVIIAGRRYRAERAARIGAARAGAA